jgi:GxxExxY protein
MNKEELFKAILDSSFEVHKALGPGLLENTYKQCLAHELKERGITVEIEKELPVVYKGSKLDCGYRLDLLVENEIIVELKAVEELTDINMAQILTYLKLSHKQLGLLINFNNVYLKNGIKRVVNNYKT